MLSWFLDESSSSGPNRALISAAAEAPPQAGFLRIRSDLDDVPLAPPEVQPDVELAKTIIQGYTKRLSRYRCDNCGFKARQFYWRCPACGGWETYPPRRSEEFDQTL